MKYLRLLVAFAKASLYHIQYRANFKPELLQIFLVPGTNHNF